MSRTYTAPSVFAGIAAGASWADPVMDPTEITDWPERQARAAIPFEVVDGRPVRPGPSTGIRYGRNELGHWGEQQCADAAVTITDEYGRRWILLIERSDGHGWALPGGYVDSGETPQLAAIRELEEAGLSLVDHVWRTLPARIVPDPRGSDESWMVTTPAMTDIGEYRCGRFPAVRGLDDARRAAWVLADRYVDLVEHLADAHGGKVFAAHREMLREILGA